MKWKAKSTGWPPDDPPDERKLFNDSLFWYTVGEKDYNDFNTYVKKFQIDKKYGLTNSNMVIKPTNNLIAGDNLMAPGWDINHVDYGNPNLSIEAKKFDMDTKNPNDYSGSVIKHYYGSDSYYRYKKPTGNALKTINSKKPNSSYLDNLTQEQVNRLFDSPNIERVSAPGYHGIDFKRKELSPISKMPITIPEQTSSLIKFRSIPKEKGSQDLPYGNYTQVGMKINPDGTKFIYDRLGRTNKLVSIDDQRIGAEEYIKELYKL